jgi:nitroreductase
MRIGPELTEPGLHPAVEAALTTRRSVRGFTGEPVPIETVRRILAASSRAPSLTNTQPWHVHVLTGPARDRLCAAVLAAHEAGETPEPEYEYYPRTWRNPYLERRREIGWALYGLLGIAKGDRAATARQHGRNYEFFGAPVGLIFTIDRALAQGSWLDLGMFMQGVMTAARGCGLDTCAQAAFAFYHAIIRRQLGVPDEQIVACGMALGHADPDKPANRLEASRVPVEAFARFHGG